MRLFLQSLGAHKFHANCCSLVDLLFGNFKDKALIHYFNQVNAILGLGILFIDYLEKGNRINSEYYMALLVRLKEEIAKKKSHMNRKKLFFTKTMHRVISPSKP